MPEYLAPGVHVEEIEIGGKPIEGVSTSTAGFLGETERGPTTPELVTSLEKFRRVYGGYAWTTKPKDNSSGETPSESYLPFAVDGFFANGGKRCYIARIVGENSKAAERAIEPPAGNNQNTTNTQALDEQHSAEHTEEVAKKEEQRRSGRRSTEEPKSEAPDTSPAVRTPADDPLFKITATGPGSWGNRIAVDIADASLDKRNSKLFKLKVRYWTNEPSSYDDTATVQEEYDNLSMDVSSPDSVEKRINGNSSLIKVDVDDPADGSQRPANTETPIRLEKGNDGTPITVEQYKGGGSSERIGLAAFEAVDEISIVCAPNENDFKKDTVYPLADALDEHCRKMKDRFAVLQAPRSAGEVGTLVPSVDSKYAAYYYPWLKVLDPATNRLKEVPPGGHVVGIYAYNDVARGVHKAPANEPPIIGVHGLQRALTKEEQAMLNPRGVNCIRTFPGPVFRVWGARTTSSDTLWKYVNVRRLFLYLEESIDEGTQWVVFEPNDHRLWARVRQSVTDFLTRVWRDGALMGRTAEEAFFVKCDETTMTADDIENGRLVVLVGVAPVRPAEFVIFRIAQWRSGSAISE